MAAHKIIQPTHEQVAQVLGLDKDAARLIGGGEQLIVPGGPSLIVPGSGNLDQLLKQAIKNNPVARDTIRAIDQALADRGA